MVEKIAEDIQILPEDDPIKAGIKLHQKNSKTTWRLSALAYAMLGIACRNNPGVAMYILYKVNPKPNQVISSLQIALTAPDGISANDSDFLEWWQNSRAKNAKKQNIIVEVFQR